MSVPTHLGAIAHRLAELEAMALIARPVIWKTGFFLVSHHCAACCLLRALPPPLLPSLPCSTCLYLALDHSRTFPGSKDPC